MEDAGRLSRMIQDDPDGWHLPYRNTWGHTIRNHMRCFGYSEGSLEVESLEDWYYRIVEQAIRLLGVEAPHNWPKEGF